MPSERIGDLKFLANENIPLTSVKLLRKKNIDIVAISEVSPGISDVEVMKNAISENRIIVTFDRDYGELIFSRNIPTPPGIIYLRFVPNNPSQPAEVIEKLLKQ